MLQSCRRTDQLSNRQIVLQRFDHVRHGVQTHHVSGAEGARAGATQLFAGQVVHHVVGQAKVFHLLHGRQHAGNADAVGNEVGCVVRAHHAFAQATGDEGFQVVQNLRLRGGRVDQLHQVHIARWVEEVDAAKARFDGFRQRFRQFGDAQARGVAGHNRTFSDEGRDLVVQVGLPVHALGNGFDDEVAACEQRHMLFVIGRLNQRGVFGHAQRCGLELFQALNRFGDDAIFRAFFGWQIKQNNWHFAIDQMGGDLRTHHTCA